MSISCIFSIKIRISPFQVVFNFVRLNGLASNILQIVALPHWLNNRIQRWEHACGYILQVHYRSTISCQAMILWFCTGKIKTHDLASFVITGSNGYGNSLSNRHPPSSQRFVDTFVNSRPARSCLFLYFCNGYALAIKY